MSESLTPLIDAIKKYCKDSKFRGHTPGHRGGKIVSQDLLDINVFEWDITEVEGMGTLFTEDGPVYESELVASKVFDSKRTLYFTQGSTSAIYTTFLALRSLGRKILVPRNAHVSVVNAIILSGLDPVWYIAQVDSNNLFLPFDVDKLLTYINRFPNIKLLLVQNPTYEGAVGDIERLAKECKVRDIVLIVDEAHGAHFLLSDKLPISANEVDCDFVIQSAHKTLPAFTGAAYLHINSNRKMINKCLEARKIVHSSSPSFLTLASLDSLNTYLINEARGLYQQLQIKSEQIYELVKESNNFEISSSSNDSDFTKIAIVFKVNQQNVSDILVEYGIIIEKWSGNVALILLTPSMSQKEFDLIIQALTEIDKLDNESFNKENIFEEIVPKQVMSVRDAYFSESEMIKVGEALGRICASMILMIPPGIPIVMPGEEISLNLSEKIKKLSIENRLSGIVEERDQLISVVKNNS